MISINYKDRRPVYEQIKQSFIRLITTEVLEPDEQIPSVRELAGQLAINPNTIQKAYAQLESEGYIYKVSGKGSFVSSTVQAAEKRKRELMDELKGIVLQIKELSVDKEEIISLLDSMYKEKNNSKGADND